MAGLCCVCGFRKTDYKFWVKKRDDGSYHYKEETLTLTVIIDRFQISPFICTHCHSRHKWIMSLPLQVCDSCHGNTKLPYVLSVRDDGSLAIEDNRCYIFKGQVTSGRVCTQCYSRNISLAHREEELDKLYQHFSKDLPAPIYRCLEMIDETEPPSQPPAEQLPVPITESAPTQLTAVEVLPPQLPPPSLERRKEKEKEKEKDVANDIVAIVETMLEIEDARSNTVTMMATIGRFLSRRSSVTAALTNAADGVFDADTFVSMQSYFLRMLQSQLATIQKDQRLYADKLVEATNKPST